ncbi:hypothetical protein DsansV1_C07g0076081 [Dioscorea sansibarensis]
MVFHLGRCCCRAYLHSRVLIREVGFIHKVELPVSNSTVQVVENHSFLLSFPTSATIYKPLFSPLFLSIRERPRISATTAFSDRLVRRGLRYFPLILVILQSEIRVAL